MGGAVGEGVVVVDGEELVVVVLAVDAIEEEWREKIS